MTGDLGCLAVRTRTCIENKKTAVYAVPVRYNTKHELNISSGAAAIMTGGTITLTGRIP